MSFKGLRLLAGVAAVCVTAAVLSAQQQQQPVFRTGVDLVQVDAVVTGDDGRPVGGLTAADFAIYENDRRQTITDFRPVTIPIGARTIDAKSPPALFVANDAPVNRRLFVLLVDNLHLSPVAMRRPKELLTELVRGLSPDDQVAVVTTGTSDASLDFTDDPALQARAVAALGARAGVPTGFVPLGVSTEISFDILENVIESLASSRHARRVVVHVSSVPSLLASAVDDRGLLHTVREGYSRTVDAARRANVAVYAVHPLGADSGELSPGTFSGYGRESGGLGFGHWTDSRTVARQILEDNSTFYVMSYYRDPANVRDREPSIEVRAAQKGLTVRARRGYVPAAATTSLTLNDALAEPLSINGVRLRASVTPGKPTGKSVDTELTLEVSYPATPGVTRIIDVLDFGVIALDYDARVVATKARQVSVDMPATADETRHVIYETIALPPGLSVVRLGVSSKRLGRSGTVHVPARIPRR